MKAVILAGGLGTRLSEETTLKPKPMVEIGSMPIIWHIMKMYSAHGIKDFIVCLGYKGSVIKDYFYNYRLMTSDISINTRSGDIQVHNNASEDWNVTLVDTGECSMTGGRVKRVAKYLANEDTFCLTYGDGVSDVNITESIRFHKEQKKLATLTAVPVAEKFGILDIGENDKIRSFKEKVSVSKTYINGGFFVLSNKVLDYIADDSTVFEKHPMEALAKEDQLSAFIHNGFWQCMDTMRDKVLLNQLWDEKKAPWKIWD